MRFPPSPTGSYPDPQQQHAAEFEYAHQGSSPPPQGHEQPQQQSPPSPRQYNQRLYQQQQHHQHHHHQQQQRHHEPYDPYDPYHTRQAPLAASPDSPPLMAASASGGAAASAAAAMPAAAMHHRHHQILHHQQQQLQNQQQRRRYDTRSADRTRQRSPQYHQRQFYHPDDGLGASAAAASSSQAATPYPMSSAATAYDGYNSDDERAERALHLEQRQYPTDAQFVHALKRNKGWVIEPMKEDGACLFRAVAYHLFGDQEMHDIVRQRCMDYMDRNRDHFEEFVTEDFDQYLQRKRARNCYGNHTEIQALTELYNRNIEVYAYSEEPINTFLATGSTEAPIRLSYHNNIHYNAIVDPNNSTFGVGLGFGDLRPGEADRKLMEQAYLESQQELIEKQVKEESQRELDLLDTQAAIEAAILAESEAEFYRQMCRSQGAGSSSDAN